MKQLIIVFFLSATLSTQALAGDHHDIILTNLNQPQFLKLSKELGLATAYKPAAPAKPLGLTGFDIGIGITMVDIEDEASYWDMATEYIPDYLPLPKLHVIKGLPFNVDIGGILFRYSILRCLLLGC